MRQKWLVGRKLSISSFVIDAGAILKIPFLASKSLAISPGCFDQVANLLQADTISPKLNLR